MPKHMWACYFFPVEKTCDSHMSKHPVYFTDKYFPKYFLFMTEGNKACVS